ncbi:hypothetical protein [Frigoribacterium sp. PhB160]|uniref:terminase small subunit n=1 Tax=Frigoribacterium sp. PhB160 TaxID=2485192 RepID=UPI0011CEC59A|nr:hypothetical protein [Frigoribacterium sp. PhB160]
MAQTPEQRRAAARERMRKKREQERGQRAAATPAPANAANVPEARPMREAVDNANAAARWLTLSDEASKEQARQLADDVDASNAVGDRAAARAAHRALSRVLNDLGATPSVRLQRELRSRRLIEEKGGGDDGHAAATGTTGVVTQFERPARRAR